MREAAGAASRLAALVGGLFGALSAILILVVLALTFANVAGRYLLGAPILGAEEATGFLVVAIVMFGAAEAYRRGDHIRIDILTGRLGPKGQARLDALSHLAVIGLSAALTVTGWHTVTFSRAFGAYSSGYLELPMWIPQSSLVIGGVLLGLLAFLRLFDMAARR